MNESRSHRVYWHRELPPLDSELMGEYELEATTGRITGAPCRATDLWDRVYGELMANTETRLQQEIARLGGDCAHVLHESVHSRRDDAVGRPGCTEYLPTSCTGGPAPTDHAPPCDRSQ
jgi:hypothetical protein